MDRKIKFRGQRKDNKEWVYGWYVYCRRHAYILPIHNEDAPDPCFDERWIQDGADDDNWFEVIPETVGQYTSLKDKNDREIYEEDWYKIDDVICLVSWFEGGFMFSGKIFDVVSIRPQVIWADGEVIGNIHENPKLHEL